MRGSVLFFFSSIFSFSLIAGSPNEWAETGLNFSSVRNIFNQMNCAGSEIQFLGCMQAANEAYASDAANKMILVSNSVFLTDEHIGDLVQDLGAVKLVKARTYNLKTGGKIMLQYKADRAADLASYRLVYQHDPMVFGNIFSDVQSRIFVDPTREAFLTSEMMNAYLSVVQDPHTRWWTRTSIERLNSGEPETFVGIGLQYRQIENTFLITRVLPESPAEAAGLQDNDILEMIDGEPTVGMTLESVKGRIRGAEGTTVRIGVLRDEVPMEFEVVRRTILVRNTEARILPQQERKIGHIVMKKFSGPSCDEVRTAIKTLAAEKSEALILDLRNNPGGQVEAARCLMGVFVGALKQVMSERRLDGGISLPTMTLNRQKTTLPLVVLINAYSASASEITSGALQYYNRAFVVGVRSYGKGTVQGVGPTRENNQIYLAQTRSTYILPSGRSPQILGITPNFEVYQVPEPTKENTVFWREEDEYFNPVSTIGKPWTETRPELVANIQNCMQEYGTARRIYDQTPRVSDYQLLTAADVLSCQLRLKNSK